VSFYVLASTFQFILTSSQSHTQNTNTLVYYIILGAGLKIGAQQVMVDSSQPSPSHHCQHDARCDHGHSDL